MMQHMVQHYLLKNKKEPVNHMIVGNANLLVKLREMKDSLTPVEQRIANTILFVPDEIPQM